MTNAPESRPSQPDLFAHSPDPLIDEVREARRWVGEQHGNDLRKHIEALRQIQRDWGGQVITDRGMPAKRAG